MTSSIAIIGAGLAGLTAANVLADRGIPTTVFERAAEPGGRAATVGRDLYRFNLGPHALYAGGEGARILDELGITVAGHVPVLDGGLALHQGRLTTFPAEPRSLLTTRLLGVRAKATMGAFLARLPALDDESLAQMTVDEWVASITGDDNARGLLHALTRLSTYANAPDQLSAGAAAAQLKLATASGVLYLDGGWSQLVDGLRRRAELRGATFVNQTVDRADTLLDQFDRVIVAAGTPSVTASLLGFDSPTSATTDTTNPLEGAAGPVAEAAVLELGVAAVPGIRFILGIDEPLYASVHAPPADLAPEGHSVVYLARYLEPGEQHDADQVRRQLTDLAGRMGIAAADIETSRYLHRMTVTGGIPLARHGGMAGRPPVDLSGDPRLLVAGDWVGARGQLADAAFASGEQAALVAAEQLATTP